MKKPLILSGKFQGDELAGAVVIVTGAGQGIGLETARSLALLGAKVIIAEVDKRQGQLAAGEINNELSKPLVEFIRTDVSSVWSINSLAKKVLKRHKKVDAIVNNAAIAPISPVEKSQIEEWDRSYGVNLRGPVLLAQKFLPGMVKNNHGVFIGVSSEGLAYMGPYESLKAAQTHLAQTIAAELEGTGVTAFTIGPGFVPTATAEDGVKQLAEYYGKTDDELYLMYKDHVLSEEAAGAAFAASVVLADNFQGQEIGAKQPLKLAGIDYDQGSIGLNHSDDELEGMLPLCRNIRKTLLEQSKGWKERPIFERQWMLRDFKKHAGMTVEQWLDTLQELEGNIRKKDLSAISNMYLPLYELAEFYRHLKDLARGYVKDEEKLEEQLMVIGQWQDTVNELFELIYSE